MARIFLIHGWGGSPDIDWFPWAKKLLEEQGYAVVAPLMPEPEFPKIEPWVKAIAAVVGEIRSDDILVGHSIGCQAVEHYLQTLPETTRLSKVILVAPWVILTKRTFEEMGENEDVVKSWYETPIDYQKIKPMAKWLAVFSDDDPFVNYEDNYKIYKEKLSADILVKQHQGHFAQEQGVTEISFLLDLVNSR